MSNGSPDILTEEITGAPVTVTIAGGDYPLAYPMHNILLFKKQSGLSLFVAETWHKIDFEEDSEIWTACLWAGLHMRLPDGSWRSPFTVEELNRADVIGLHNAVKAHNAMFRALTSWMPRKQSSEDAADPAKDESAEKKILTLPEALPGTMTEATLPASGYVLNADSGLVGPNS